MSSKPKMNFKKTTLVAISYIRVEYLPEGEWLVWYKLTFQNHLFWGLIKYKFSRKTFITMHHSAAIFEASMEKLIMDGAPFCNGQL